MKRTIEGRLEVDEELTWRLEPVITWQVQVKATGALDDTYVLSDQHSSRERASRMLDQNRSASLYRHCKTK